MKNSIDIISTAGTITQAAQALKDAGAGRIMAMATHPVFSGKALERLAASCIEETVATNSIPFTKDGKHSRVKVLDVAPLLGEAIRRIHTEESISILFV